MEQFKSAAKIRREKLEKTNSNVKEKVPNTAEIRLSLEKTQEEQQNTATRKPNDISDQDKQQLLENIKKLEETVLRRKAEREK